MIARYVEHAVRAELGGQTENGAPHQWTSSSAARSGRVSWVTRRISKPPSR
jgi:hypothetical protein